MTERLAESRLKLTIYSLGNSVFKKFEKETSFKSFLKSGFS